MSLQQQIDKYFAQNKLLEIFVKYELYYQIGLGKIIYISLQDFNDTYKKIMELNLKIDSSSVINNLYFILLHFSDENNFEERLEYYIRSSALSQALNDYIDKDKDFHRPELFADMVYQEITDDRFFDSSLRDQFDEQYDLVYVSFEPVFTKKFVQSLKDSVIEIFKYNKHI